MNAPCFTPNTKKGTCRYHGEFVNPDPRYCEDCPQCEEEVLEDEEARHSFED